MFLCNDCHDKDCPLEWIEKVALSRGPCEACKRVSNCYDCHGYKLTRAKD